MSNLSNAIDVIGGRIGRLNDEVAEKETEIAKAAVDAFQNLLVHSAYEAMHVNTPYPLHFPQYATRAEQCHRQIAQIKREVNALEQFRDEIQSNTARARQVIDVVQRSSEKLLSLPVEWPQT